MTTPSLSVQVERLEDTGRPTARRRRRIVVGALVAIVAAAGTSVGLWRYGSHRATPPADAAASYPTALATVTEQSLSSRTQLNGRLGYAGSYGILAQVQGVVTAVPSVGTVVHEGEVLYRADERPVVLLSGSTPMYRDLAEGAADADVSGRDVAQLNRALIRLGYADGLGLDPHSDQFGWATKVAIERLQEHLGVNETGRLGRGQVVFLPTAARITAVSASSGAPVAPGAPIMQASSTRRQVTLALDAGQQSQVKVGDKVTVTLPDEHTAEGVVSRVGTVATSPSSGSSASGSTGGSGSDSSPTVPVDITPNDQASLGNLDQAPVQVTIVAATVKDALAVPITALLSRPAGQYAVEVVDAAGPHRLVTVRTGLFDDADGLVQVTGDGLAAGQHVVVPST